MFPSESIVLSVNRKALTERKKAWSKKFAATFSDGVPSSSISGNILAPKPDLFGRFWHQNQTRQGMVFKMHVFLKR